MLEVKEMKTRRTEARHKPLKMSSRVCSVTLRYYFRSGRKEYLTKDRLIKFMNETQRDCRLNELIVPLFNDARVQKFIIEKFETDEKYIKEGKKVFFDAVLPPINSLLEEPDFICFSQLGVKVL